MTDDQIERMVADLLQVARVSLLELQPVETRLRSSSISCGDQIFRNADSHYFSPQEG